MTADGPDERAAASAKRSSTTGYLWFAVVCFACAVAWCVLAIIEGIPLGRLPATEEIKGVDFVLHVVLMTLAVFGTLACTLLMVVDLFFGRRGMMMRWTPSALVVNSLTIALLLSLHKTGPWVLHLLLHGW
jgi:predicted branched-subunit amino acid permease